MILAMGGLLRALLMPRLWLVASVGCLAALAATGAWLSVRYRPSATFGGQSRPGGIALMHDLHQVAAVAMYVALGGLVVALGVRAVRAVRAPLVVAALVCAAAAAVLAYTSAADLPWRLLGLRAVRVDFRIEGVWTAAFDPIVRFVLTDREMSQREYRVFAVAHLVAAPLLMVVSLAMAWVGARCRRVRR